MERLPEWFSKLLPLKVKRFTKGYGSFLFFELLRNESEFPVEIWIYLCDWRLVDGNGVLSTSDGDSSPFNFTDVFNEKQKLLALNEPKKGRLDFIFLNDYKLMLKSNLEEYAPQDDLVKITIDDSVFGYTEIDGFKIHVKP